MVGKRLLPTRFWSAKADGKQIAVGSGVMGRPQRPRAAISFRDRAAGEDRPGASKDREGSGPGGPAQRRPGHRPRLSVADPPIVGAMAAAQALLRRACLPRQPADPCPRSGACRLWLGRLLRAQFAAQRRPQGSLQQARGAGWGRRASRPTVARQHCPCNGRRPIPLPRPMRRRISPQLSMHGPKKL